MNLRCLIALSFVVSLYLCPAAAHPQAPPSPLEQGSSDNRLELLVNIVSIPPEQRGSAVLRSVEREARRMLTYHRGAQREDETERELSSAYAAGLVRVLGESRDPAYIPLLIEYAGLVGYAAEALIHFGDLAVPEMIRVVKEGRNDLRQSGLYDGCPDRVWRPCRAGAAPNRARRKGR